MTLDALTAQAAEVEERLRQIAENLPADPYLFFPQTKESSAVVSNLLQAVARCQRLAVASCPRLGLGEPAAPADALRSLAGAGVLSEDLARRVRETVEFRNRIVRAFADLNMAEVYSIATTGRADLAAFLTALQGQSGSASAR
ncbi:MAG TPA: DUF86 domain-containing protein [Pseudonocardia sp.]|jgi:uncharacterized protein YutE (UPF0331/DUF86 family)